jgi:hypothetical protein
VTRALPWPGPLARKRGLTALTLWTERLVPALAPPVALILVPIGLAAFGAFAFLPPEAGPFLGVALLLGACIWAAVLLRRLVAPSPAEIDRTLERPDPFRPLTTLADRPAWPGAEQVWHAHQVRARARIAQLHPPLPRAGGAGIALAAALLFGIAGLLIPHGAARLRAALMSPAQPAPPPSIQAWIVPPPAAGLPPIFLPARATQPVPVPVGSRLTVSVQGGIDRPALLMPKRRLRLRRLDRFSYQAVLTLVAPGTLVLRRDGAILARWQLDVAPPAPPHIVLAPPVKTEWPQLRLTWQATDRFALREIDTEIRLRDRPGAAPLVVSSQLAGHPRTAGGGLLPDLTASPWAGLPVLVRLKAVNTEVQYAFSDDAPALLPERAFLNPIARALVALRRRLALDPLDRDPVRRDLDVLSVAAVNRVTQGEFLGLRVIAAMLADPAAQLDQVQTAIWRLARAIEDGGVRDARQRLDDARQGLRDALAATPGPEQQRRAQQLAAQMRQAMQDYIAQLARKAARDGMAPPEDGKGRTIDAGQLDQMARQMQEAANSGRLQEALQRLQQLGALLDHLHPSGKLAQTGQNGQRNKALDQLTQSQAALNGDTDHRIATPSPNDSAARSQEGSQQSTLRDKLGDLAQQLGDQSGSVPDGLAHADTAMRDAANALKSGDDRAADAAQRRALQGLRDGAQQLAQQQQGAGQGQRPGAGAGQAQGTPGKGKDPLGRPLDQDAGNAPDFGDNAETTQADVARSRAIRDELRRRAADRTRPPAELDYLERLLGE